jgi:ABC-type spermidine/putrescine transport system permease subunit II
MLRSNAEVVAIVCAVVAIELFGLNLLNRLFGISLGSLLSICFVVLVGIALAIALSGNRQRSGVYTAMVAWVVTCGAVTYFQLSRPDAVVDSRAVAAAAVLGVGILSLYLVKPLSVREQQASDLLEPSASPTQ